MDPKLNSCWSFIPKLHVDFNDIQSEQLAKDLNDTELGLNNFHHNDNNSDRDNSDSNNDNGNNITKEIEIDLDNSDNSNYSNEIDDTGNEIDDTGNENLELEWTDTITNDTIKLPQNPQNKDVVWITKHNHKLTGQRNTVYLQNSHVIIPMGDLLDENDEPIVLTNNVFNELVLYDEKSGCKKTKKKSSVLKQDDSENNNNENNENSEIREQMNK